MSLRDRPWSRSPGTQTSKSLSSIQHVPYKGAQAALPDLLAGRVDIFLGQANALLPHIESGCLRLLAGTGAKRYASLPQVPTVGEALPGFSVDIWSGFVAPAKTPADVIRKANADVMRVLAMPDVQAVFAKQRHRGSSEHAGSDGDRHRFRSDKLGPRGQRGEHQGRLKAPQCGAAAARFIRRIEMNLNLQGKVSW